MAERLVAALGRRRRYVLSFCTGGRGEWNEHKNSKHMESPQDEHALSGHQLCSIMAGVAGVGRRGRGECE